MPTFRPVLFLFRNSSSSWFPHRYHAARHNCPTAHVLVPGLFTFLMAMLLCASPCRSPHPSTVCNPSTLPPRSYRTTTHWVVCAPRHSLSSGVLQFANYLGSLTVLLNSCVDVTFPPMPHTGFEHTHRFPLHSDFFHYRFQYDLFLHTCLCWPWPGRALGAFLPPRPTAPHLRTPIFRSLVHPSRRLFSSGLYFFPEVSCLNWTAAYRVLPLTGPLVTAIVGLTVDTLSTSDLTLSALAYGPRLPPF